MTLPVEKLQKAAQMLSICHRVEQSKKGNLSPLSYKDDKLRFSTCHGRALFVVIETRFTFIVFG